MQRIVMCMHTRTYVVPGVAETAEWQYERIRRRGGAKRQRQSSERGAAERQRRSSERGAAERQRRSRERGRATVIYQISMGTDRQSPAVAIVLAAAET
eukprot:366556-Chlamydomonas_euryale.AAC.8